MKRRQFVQQMGGLGLLSVLPSSIWAAPPILLTGAYQVIRNNVGYYTERGGTIACLLTPTNSVVVDTQFPAQAENLVALMEERGAPLLDLLINTHHHGDHTSGNIVFKNIAKTHVAHENARANQERVAKDRDKLAETLLPATTFSDNWSQRVGDEIISLRYFGAAHTNGDAVIHFENANVVHLGDLLFNRRFPYIDKSAGADIGNWIEVLRKARRTFDKDTLYIFGHAGEGYPVTGDAKDLKAMSHFLKMSLRFIKKSVKKGQSLDDLLASTTTIPGSPEWKGKGIERVIRAGWTEVMEGK